MISDYLKHLLSIESRCIDEEDPTSWKQPFGTRYFRDGKELTLPELLDFYSEFTTAVQDADGGLTEEEFNNITSFGECLDWACGHPIPFEDIRAYHADPHFRERMYAPLSLRQELQYILVSRSKERPLAPGHDRKVPIYEAAERANYVADAFIEYLAAAGIKLEREHFLVTNNHVVINVPMSCMGLKEEPDGRISTGQAD